MAELNSGLDAGDETRHHGDYVGFPHGESDGTPIGEISGPVEGELVTLDGSGNVAAATVDGAGGGDPILGVLYTYQYHGDSSRNGPYVNGDRDATVKMGGSVVVDVSGLGASPSAGERLGPNGEVLVLTDPVDGLAEVRL